MAGLYGKNDQEKRDVLDPIFGSYTSDHALSKYELNKEPVPPEIAYRIVKDQLLDEGNARENLATFCQTYMEPKATQIMAETMQKKMLLTNQNIHELLNLKIVV